MFEVNGKEYCYCKECRYRGKQTNYIFDDEDVPEYECPKVHRIVHDDEFCCWGKDKNEVY